MGTQSRVSINVAGVTLHEGRGCGTGTHRGHIAFIPHNLVALNLRGVLFDVRHQVSGRVSGETGSCRSTLVPDPLSSSEREREEGGDEEMQGVTFQCVGRVEGAAHTNIAGTLPAFHIVQSRHRDLLHGVLLDVRH